MRNRSIVRGALAFAVVAIAASASATVTQVDGSIVPFSDAGLNCFLGGSATPACGMFTYFTRHGEEPQAGAMGAAGVNGPFGPNDINPVADAAEAPVEFLPNLGSAVVFEDIGEGAGFEDSFGWFNVGDDVQTAAGQIKNLHIVLGVGVKMAAKTVPFNPADNTQHYGDPAEYVQNSEETSPGTGPGLASVDFNEELAAGRYKGGFISFYMITPEGSPAGDNHGDFTVTAGSNGKSEFGKIYFTNKDLNNDGDFVHYLVYISKLKPQGFIFGFEDLFRGGDNDFEDMLVRVVGLTPPCIPTAEICDGIDNDCDGKIDENVPTPLPGTGSACTCDSSGDCDDGPKLGACANGTTVCENGAITCHSSTNPTSELCDGLDNNCNGVVDDNPTNVGSACGSNSTGACKLGHTICSNGGVVCTGIVGPTPEICDGIDNDCDGKTDEGNPGGGGACGSNVGICTQGTLVCTGGSLVCTGGTQPGTEVCNGLDDNCNGIVDDNPTDVGSACGSNSTGACKLGQTICVGGAIQCAGTVGPTPEICDGIDNDCDGKIDDNPVDVGQPCGSSIGACSPGRTVCVGGAIVCQGATGPTAEVCDGIDNDCDGTVDEDVPGVGSSCDVGSGSDLGSACSGGIERCINGGLRCVGGGGSGIEICNGIDDDCDGKIDEGTLCGSGGECEGSAGCAAPCVVSEFPCPQGKICNAQNFCVDDPCAGVNCQNDMAGNEQVCVGGVCEPICSTVTCTAPQVCRGTDGTCVANTCDYLPLCTAGQICLNSQCVTDPCAGVTCSGNTPVCSQGTCIASCSGVECAAAQMCQAGACVATGCPEACVGNTVCDPTTMQCVINSCPGQFCPPNQVCDPLTTMCISDPCLGVTCPDGQTCSSGQCGVGASGQLVTAAGGGCDAGGGSEGGFAMIGVALLALLLRKRRALLLPLVASASLASAGCKLNNYCIDCETGDGGTGGSGDGGSGNTGDGGTTGDGGSGSGFNCNFSGSGLDTTDDPLNCGGCGVQCIKTGAETACNASQCEIVACYPGHIDFDHDITGPYASSDGCEYACFPSGVEACDGLDNNCDMIINEGFDLSNDVNNCGACNHVCEFFEATPHCSNMMCSFDPATDCKPGFFDIDHLQMDGCEYQCTPTNGGVEKCDLIDNDCDGVVDNGFNTMTDVNNCGACGNACSFPNATPSCTAGKCGFNPATDCAPGFVDLNGNPLDGCEYKCTKTNGGVEKCDGLDNDCNGVVDDHTSDSGGACASTGAPKGACIANGVTTCAGGHLVCSGATEPTQETCNDIDDDCNGVIDNGVVRSCYTGPANTQGVGQCVGGTQTCAAGVFPTACAGQVTPITELCNGLDDDCDGQIDNGPGGAAITASCYSGPTGTEGVGTCHGGTKTCAFGAFGNCAGEVDPTIDVCGDNLDTDCDGKGDTAEGCLAEDAEFRLDGPAGSAAGQAGTLGTAAGAQHSHDVVTATGGNPFGTNVYVAWNELVGSTTEIYLRTSTNGGKTWNPIVNVTSGIANPNVEPQIAVQPSGTAGGADTVVIAYQNVASGLRDINVAKSTNSGATWTTTTKAIDGSADSFHQAIAFSGTTVVVTWESLNTTTLNRDVVAAASTDGGSTFKAAYTVNVGSATNTTRFAGRPQVGITSAGAAVFGWREQRTGATRDIFAAFATDPTKAPSADIRIDGDTQDNRDSDFPVLAVVGTAAYLAWQDTSTLANGGSDIIEAQSLDGGQTWTTERVIDDPGTHVSDSFAPSIAVDPRGAAQNDDLVALVWQDEREGTQVFSSVSQNGGSTFPGAIRASNEDGAPATGTITVPWIASAGPNTGVFVVSWQSNQTEQLGSPPTPTATSHVFSSSTIDNGVSWTVSQALLDGGTAANGPHVTAGLENSKPTGVTAWTDFRTNHIDGDIYEVGSHN